MVAADPGLPYVTFEHPAYGRQTVRLPADAGTATIGRRPDNTIPLPWDPNVSRLHAQLQQAGGEWLIIDDGLSYNGTEINGQPLTGRRRLHNGDVITIGLTRLTYHTPQDPSSPTHTAQPRTPAPPLTETQRRVLVALSRPCLAPDTLAPPATNRHIATELRLSTNAVKFHLRNLYNAFGIPDLPHNQKRIRLVAEAINRRAITP